MNKSKLYRPPDVALSKTNFALELTLITRLLRFLYKLGFRQQAVIKMPDVAHYVKRRLENKITES